MSIYDEIFDDLLNNEDFIWNHKHIWEVSIEGRVYGIYSYKEHIQNTLTAMYPFLKYDEAAVYNLNVNFKYLSEDKLDENTHDFMNLVRFYEVRDDLKDLDLEQLKLWGRLQ